MVRGLYPIATNVIAEKIIAQARCKQKTIRPSGQRWAVPPPRPTPATVKGMKSSYANAALDSTLDILIGGSSEFINAIVESMALRARTKKFGQEISAFRWARNKLSEIHSCP